MTADDGNLFSRWSRRKQAARTGEASVSEGEGHEAPETTSQTQAERVDRQPGKEEPSEPLPRLEDLTAESDLSAFLRKDVPQALKRAAMRKIWSLDPAIRDYVGPSEYAWNFNEAGSMAGFGPLEPGEAVVGFLSTIGRGMPVDEAERDAAAAAPPAEPTLEPQSDAASREQVARAATDDPPDSPVKPEPAAAGPQPPAPGRIEAPGGVTKEADRAGSPRATARKRHGGALPR